MQLIFIVRALAKLEHTVGNNGRPNFTKTVQNHFFNDRFLYDQELYCIM